MNKLTKSILWLSVFSLIIEIDLFQIFGGGIKAWMIMTALATIILVWWAHLNGWKEILGSRILLFGAGFGFFALLGIFNSPQVAYSLKQLVVLAVLIILAVFFERQIKRFPKTVYAALAVGITVSSLAAIYQNVAFAWGWPHFEFMPARPNAFFP